MFLMNKKEDILKAIKKIEDKKRFYETNKTKADEKIQEFLEYASKNPNKAYTDEEKMEITGNCHYISSKCEKEIKKCDEILAKLNEKLNKKSQR